LVISTGKDYLGRLIHLQLRNFFMYSKSVDDYLDPALERLEKCFADSSDKYYKKEGEIHFSPYHSGQYSIFLYYLANTAYRMDGDPDLCTVLYYLNKSLNSVDWFYALELPESFGVEHPLGSVLGRAKFSNHLFFYQGCTIGGIQRGKRSVYPTLGEYVTLCANSSVLGECNIGNYVIIGADALVKNQDIPDNSIVFGSSPNLKVDTRGREEMKKMYEDIWEMK